MAKMLRYVEKITELRAYIENISAEDKTHNINSLGTLAKKNAYGELVAEYDDGTEGHVICGHGGSMWLCRECKDKILSEERAHNDHPT